MSLASVTILRSPSGLKSTSTSSSSSPSPPKNLTRRLLLLRFSSNANAAGTRGEESDFILC